MNFTEDQLRQFNEWGVDPKTLEQKPIEEKVREPEPIKESLVKPKPIEPEPTKPLPISIPPISVRKTNWTKIIFALMLGIFIGIIGFGIFIETGLLDEYISSRDVNQTFTNGMRFALNSISKEVIQCNLVPVEYADYNYTLIAAECLQNG